jgi:hypothetical protein
MKRRSWFKRQSLISFLMVIGIALVVASCATQPGSQNATPPGFFSGLLHGFLMPFSFIGSFVTDGRIYAYPNSGRSYDFGYLIGAFYLFGEIGYRLALNEVARERERGES